MIIGYGSGNSEKNAKESALNEIVSQIAVTIKNEVQKTQSLNSNNYNKNIKINSYQKSLATIYGYKVIKLEYEKGKYFVAIEYENIPSIDKFAKKTKLKKEFITEAIKNDFGIKEGIELIRKDKKWFIKYKNIMQVLDKRDFERFFTTILNKTLSIYINKKFIGYYLYIEWLGKHFLEKRGYNASTELYQPDDTTYCGDFRHGSKLERFGDLRLDQWLWRDWAVRT
jgi:hypothetical protein